MTLTRTIEGGDRDRRSTVMAIWEAGGPYESIEAMLPEPTADQLLVDIDAAGVCHADLAARDGMFPVPLPAVLGHEGTGTVRAVGPGVRNAKIGDRVVLTFDSCHRCPSCTAGRFTRCDRYMHMNFGGQRQLEGQPVVATTRGDLFSGFFGQSSFGTRAMASERNAVVLDVDLPPHLLAPLGCAVQTGAGAVLNVAPLHPGAVVAIVGLGPVGFSALTAATQFTAARTVIAVDLSDERLKLAQELGAGLVINAADGRAFEHIANDGGADVIVECSGAPKILPNALTGLRIGGTLVVVGAPPFGTTAPIDVADVVNRSLTIKGTVEGDSQPQRLIPWLAEMVLRGRWPLNQIVHTYPMANIETAAKDMLSGRVIKPVLLNS